MIAACSPGERDGAAITGIGCGRNRGVRCLRYVDARFAQIRRSNHASRPVSLGNASCGHFRRIAWRAGLSREHENHAAGCCERDQIAASTPLV
jgi:hypothetical protein